jgi:hypothetical protein
MPDSHDNDLKRSLIQCIDFIRRGESTTPNRAAHRALALLCAALDEVDEMGAFDNLSKAREKFMRARA